MKKIIGILIAIVGIVLLIIYSVKQKNNLLKRFFTPGIVMIIGITGVGVIASHGMQICNWDELYQWGKAANYMVIYDQLPSGANFSGESAIRHSSLCRRSIPSMPFDVEMIGACAAIASRAFILMPLPMRTGMIEILPFKY